MNALDQLWSNVVRRECGPQCLLCPRLAGEAHHVLRRSQFPMTAVKYEPDFGVCLCLHCHPVADGAHGFELVVNALWQRDPERATAILAYLDTEIEMAPATEAEQRAYLRWRLREAQRHWADKEVDAAPVRRWQGATP